MASPVLKNVSLRRLHVQENNMVHIWRSYLIKSNIFFSHLVLKQISVARQMAILGEYI